MITITDLVMFVFIAICVGIIVALLWFALTYAQSKLGGPPMFWNIVTLIFVLLLVFIGINLILELMGGTPMVRFK